MKKKLTVSVAGNDDLEAFPVIEIIPDTVHEFFDSEAKYTAGVTQEICPARIDDGIAERVQGLAKKTYRAPVRRACKKPFCVP